MLNLDLRWSIFPPPWEVNCLQASPSVNLGTSVNLTVQNMKNGLGYADVPVISFVPGGKANNALGYYSTQKANFSPRISVAYSPRAKDGLFRTLFGGSDQTVIRGGFSIVYDPARLQLGNTFDANPPPGFSTNLTHPRSPERPHSGAR